MFVGNNVTVTQTIRGVRPRFSVRLIAQLREMAALRPWWMPSPKITAIWAVVLYVSISGASLDFAWPWDASASVIRGIQWEFANNLDNLTAAASMMGIGLCVTALFCWLLALVDFYYKPQETRIRPELITNFRDSSPYGDAALADRDSIQRAMMGHNIPDAPQFEE